MPLARLALILGGVILAAALTVGIVTAQTGTSEAAVLLAGGVAVALVLRGLLARFGPRR